MLAHVVPSAPCVLRTSSVYEVRKHLTGPCQSEIIPIIPPRQVFKWRGHHARYQDHCERPSASRDSRTLVCTSAAQGQCFPAFTDVEHCTVSDVPLSRRRLLCPRRRRVQRRTRSCCGYV